MLNTHVEKNSGANLIDFNSADASLLLQYALPQNIATTPHPTANVKGWKPSFNAAYKTDSRYQAVLEWINEVHGPRWTDNDLTMIGFKAPSGRIGAATQPAPAVEPGAAKPTTPPTPSKTAPTAAPAAGPATPPKSNK